MNSHFKHIQYQKLKKFKNINIIINYWKKTKIQLLNDKIF